LIIKRPATTNLNIILYVVDSYDFKTSLDGGQHYYDTKNAAAKTASRAVVKLLIAMPYGPCSQSLQNMTVTPSIATILTNNSTYEHIDKTSFAQTWRKYEPTSPLDLYLGCDRRPECLGNWLICSPKPTHGSAH
jgi:hypothetical protein